LIPDPILSGRSLESKSTSTLKSDNPLIHHSIHSSIHQDNTGQILMKPRLLCLSNGHGEDVIASRILKELLLLQVDVAALPIVGEGYSYRQSNIEILGETQVMPSGGFIYQDWRQMWRDLRSGLLGLTGRQLHTIRTLAPQVQLVLAVGDIVVLAMAWWSGSPYAFVGTAKSDYYWRDEAGPYRQHRLWTPQSDYLPWERWLMTHPRCRGVFPRDSLTAQGLKRLGVSVLDRGNPMMDGFSLAPFPGSFSDTLLLLPGSRPPEAYANWQLMMQVIQSLPDRIQITAAIAPTLDLNQLSALIPPQKRSIKLYPGEFNRLAQQADVVLAMAGTATEQCVGLGKPVVTLPGKGPQFTPAFAEAQTRLLGPSLYLCSVSTAAAKIESLLHQLHEDPNFRTALLAQGQRRMGSPGASHRIAVQIHHWLTT
jgi:uncharacterized protein (TIGR03492 family)